MEAFFENNFTKIQRYTLDTTSPLASPRENRVQGPEGLEGPEGLARTPDRDRYLERLTGKGNNDDATDNRNGCACNCPHLEVLHLNHHCASTCSTLLRGYWTTHCPSFLNVFSTNWRGRFYPLSECQVSDVDMLQTELAEVVMGGADATTQTPFHMSGFLPSLCFSVIWVSREDFWFFFAQGPYHGHMSFLSAAFRYLLGIGIMISDNFWFG
ncbi:hypothetical protein QBC35DRAFT_166781 [Podospora australis]|uniref:Uncharacterized protein n=1 Tax=Podospora australis TaxID=1536484 RepID=A0AAN6WWU4_9PEZI|nr:hypothetical protein QBC35DRAFT_166781 [Podospora australis]